MFALADPNTSSSLLTARELRKRLATQVTETTIHNYRKRGMPAELGPDGVYAFELSACTRWIAENIAGGKGGKRPGAGRKPADPANVIGQSRFDSPPPSAPTPDPRHPTHDPPDSDDDTSGDGGGGVGDIKALISTFRGPQDIARIAAEGQGSPFLLKALNDLVTVQAKAIEADRVAGRLVDVEQAKEEWAAAMQSIRGALDNLPATLSQRLIAAGLITADREQLIRAEVEREVDRALAVLAKDAQPHEAPPPESPPAPAPAQPPTQLITEAAA